MCRQFGNRPGVPHRALRTAALACLLVTAAGIANLRAAERPTAPVPPHLEIEVLDPNVDPNGNPAVIAWSKPKSDHMEIDIPPAVLVHRYYYTGERSFQGPMLPGGPSILVVNHPKTGERCYIPAQMLPGAPRVTYSSHGIEYDYGQHGITLKFGLLGEPSVKYRSSLPWREKAAKAVHADKIAAGTKKAVGDIKTGVAGVGILAGDAAKMVTLPAQNAVGFLPFGKVVFNRDAHEQLVERVGQHHRDHAAKKAEERARRDEATYRTIR